MIKQIILTLLISPFHAAWGHAIGEGDRSPYSCQNHLEHHQTYDGPLSNQLAFHPERSFYQDRTLTGNPAYIDKAQITVNIQGGSLEERDIYSYQY
jgi:hypothetical protein